MPAEASDSSSNRQPTPEFIRWAIKRPCQLRLGNQWEAPEQTERTLRSLRAYSLAERAGHIQNEICIQTELPADWTAGKNAGPFGFRSSDVLNPLGGLELIESQCNSCPANVPSPTSNYANCFGHFTADDFGTRGIGALDLQLCLDALCTVLTDKITKKCPRWRRLWQRTVWEGQALDELTDLFTDLINAPGALGRRVLTFQKALVAARKNQLPVITSWHPSGQLDDTHWYVDPHCPTCLSSKPFVKNICDVCGYQGQPNPSRRRTAVGIRPFRQVSSFLSEEEIASHSAE